MDTDNLLQSIANVAGKVRGLGIGLLILGAIAVYAPQAAGMTVSFVVGIVLIIAGIVRTIFSGISPGWGSLILRAAVGILTVIAGTYMIMMPGEGSQALAIVLVFYLIADGVTSLVIALRLPPAAGGSWVMLSAIASLIIAIMLWRQWPASGELAIGVLIGIKLILDGVTLIGLGSAAKAAAS